jgi:hypothetical protein
LREDMYEPERNAHLEADQFIHGVLISVQLEGGCPASVPPDVHDLLLPATV